MNSNQNLSARVALRLKADDKVIYDPKRSGKAYPNPEVIRDLVPGDQYKVVGIEIFGRNDAGRIQEFSKEEIADQGLMLDESFPATVNLKLDGIKGVRYFGYFRKIQPV